MTYYLYANEHGLPDITSYKLLPEVAPGHTLLGEHDNYPSFAEGKRYVAGQWVPLVSEYLFKRKKAYPTYAEQFDALWHAMDEGVLPKVPAFYDPIKAVKDRIPKE